MHLLFLEQSLVWELFLFSHTVQLFAALFLPFFVRVLFVINYALFLMFLISPQKSPYALILHAINNTIFLCNSQVFCCEKSIDTSK